jgi:hypothetical protein
MRKLGNLLRLLEKNVAELGNFMRLVEKILHELGNLLRLLKKYCTSLEICYACMLGNPRARVGKLVLVAGKNIESWATCCGC